MRRLSAFKPITPPGKCKRCKHDPRLRRQLYSFLELQLALSLVGCLSPRAWKGCRSRRSQRPWRGRGRRMLLCLYAICSCWGWINNRTGQASQCAVCPPRRRTNGSVQRLWNGHCISCAPSGIRRLLRMYVCLPFFHVQGEAKDTDVLFYTARNSVRFSRRWKHCSRSIYGQHCFVC